MKYFLFAGILFTVAFFACDHPQDNYKVNELATRVDSLEKNSEKFYKPGFGELMSNIQTHHIKLWFAGKNKNWPLADFEIHEIIESFEDIAAYETDRPETKLASIILPDLDSVSDAINRNDEPLFERSYTNMTATCNDCHHNAKFEFNEIKIPESNPFSDQEFEMTKNK
ncbi:MAG: hypothetical protein HY064_12375 [Bacteroidetes bacterium]|nr:hypothetical protein [Bacteroidota bacterium]